MPMAFLHFVSTKIRTESYGLACIGLINLENHYPIVLAKTEYLLDQKSMPKLETD